jgi:hypothetical protein
VAAARRPRVRRGYLPTESEAAFQQALVNLAVFCGWRVHHNPAGGHAGRVDREQIGPGFPDLVMTRGDRLVVAELKAANGRVGPGQQEWLDALAAAGAEAFLWRPADWPEIERVLAVQHQE